MKYYTLNNLLKAGKDCKYLICFGERSNGKTHSIIKYGLEDWVKNGRQIAILRRWYDDFQGKRGAAYFDSLVCDGNGVNQIKKITGGQYDRVVYQAQRWYLAYFNDELNKVVTQNEPFALAFAISMMEREKGNSYPKVGTIFFDEFMTRQRYIPNEFVLFMNVVSTLVRQRDDIKIFMAANTVSLYCPYFKEMGLTHIKDMKKGNIEVYTYGNSKLKVAVEYADSPSKLGKPSDVYFAFDNPSLKMITSGAFELDIYPHITVDFERKDILFIYFVKFEDTILQCEIVSTDNMLFTYVHLKTSEIKNIDDDIIYDLEPNEQHNYYKNLLYPVDKLSQKITHFYKANKVFYQSNDIGEIMNHYLNQCRKAVMH